MTLILKYKTYFKAVIGNVRFMNVGFMEGRCPPASLPVAVTKGLRQNAKDPFGVSKGGTVTSTSKTAVFKVYHHL